MIFLIIHFLAAAFMVWAFMSAGHNWQWYGFVIAAVIVVSFPIHLIVKISRNQSKKSDRVKDLERRLKELEDGKE